MEQEEFKSASNANFIHDIEEFSDDLLKDENFKAPTDSKKTTYKEDLPNANTNNIISTRNTTTKKITINKFRFFYIFHIIMLFEIIVII